MRISTTQIFQSGVSSMQRAQVDLNHTSLQLSTGRRILTPADDPGGATQSAQLEARINATEQYQRNADLAVPRLEREEAALVGVNDYLQRIRELVLSGNNSTQNDETRGYIASEIRQLREDLIGVANTKDPSGEYLFSGTHSLQQPFLVSSDGVVSYAGAKGVDAVREVAITPTRTLAIGDAGDYVFMEVPEKSNRVPEAVPNRLNTGALVVDNLEISDFAQFQQTASETYQLRFSNSGAGMEYEALDSAGNPVMDPNGDPIAGSYVPGEGIEVLGRHVTLSGTPDDGDEVILRPAKEVSLFKTLDDIATALEKQVFDTQSREVLDGATGIALLNIDAGLDRLNEVRASVGKRLQTLDSQQGFNEEALIDLKSTLSDIRDLDYADAISRFKLQEVVLQAAQQSYVQVSRLSLFNFL